MGSDHREELGQTPWRPNPSRIFWACVSRLCMRYLWISTRPMTHWTGGAPWWCCKGMGWAPRSSKSWPAISLELPCGSRLCMRSLWISTRPMTHWTGGAPWWCCKGMGWAPRSSKSWPDIYIELPWRKGWENTTGDPSRGTGVSPRGYPLPPKSSILWWTRLYTSGLYFWHRTRSDLMDLSTRWQRRWSYFTHMTA